MRRTIRMKLDPTSIQGAIDQLESYKASLKARAADGAAEMARQGAEEARGFLASALPVAVRGSWTTGALASSVKAVPDSFGAKVTASGSNAAYVEFGTGVRGAAKPHPSMPWGYDSSGHGDEGWYFPDPSSPTGETWTTGLPSTPFMWHAAEWLKANGAAAFMKGWRS